MNCLVQHNSSAVKTRTFLFNEEIKILAYFTRFKTFRGAYTFYSVFLLPVSLFWT